MPAIPTLIILAGGASSRMWPLREKSLLRFGTEPLLISQLRRYRELGFDHAIIVGNPENVDDIRTLTRDLPGMHIEVTMQAEPIGMGDAILQAAPLLAAETPVYITQVHDVVDSHLHLDALAHYQAHPDHSVIVGYEMQDYFPGGYLIVDGERRITGIVEKPGAANRPSNLVVIVDHIHSQAGPLMEAIRAEYARDVPTDDHYERAMDRLMKDHHFQAVPYAGHWSALKFPWHTLDIMDYFLSQIKGQHIPDSAFVAPTAALMGDVYLGEKVRIFPGAAVVGPAYIGSGTVVGNNSLVRGSMVLDNCNVGFTTEIARSYVADGCQMHACRVLDSVFAPNINFSAGCTTANLRIDRGSISSRIKDQPIDTGREKLGAIIGADAFLAVDVMTMPGVKVGERAQVGPGTHVIRDVKDGQRIYVKQEQVIVDAD